MIDKAFEQAEQLARDQENEALIKADLIIAEMQRRKKETDDNVARIENEINNLEEELQLIKSIIQYNGCLQSRQVTASSDQQTKAPKSIFQPGPIEEDKNYYVIKLLAFLNARHYVVFGVKAGPVHAHSWQFKVDVKVPVENAPQIAFGDILKSIKNVLEPFESSLLNVENPFSEIMPTTENMAAVFFDRIEGEISKLGIRLCRISVWESPTKGIEVSGVPENLYKQVPYNPIPAQNIDAMSHAAATISEPNKPAPSLPNPRRCSNVVEKAKPGLNTGKKSTNTVEFKKYPLTSYLVGGALILLAVVTAYYNLLFPPTGQIYPWGSDTWGHLQKAEYLYGEILHGNFFPEFTADWYNGYQPFRYYAPLPYYIMVILREITGNIFSACNLYIFVCVLTGSLFWLFFAGRMGIWPATMAGILWAVWPDNVRVALSEGNMPRILTTALLPLIFISFCRSVENNKPVYLITTVALIHLVILCHAMLGAIFCVCLTLFAFFLFVFRGCSLPDILRGMLALFMGVLTSSWWLLPSLTGGITEINAEAVTKIVTFVPANISLNPFYRFTSMETFYWGASLLAGILISVFFWKSKPPWARSLLVCGIIIMVFTFPVSRLLHSTMPLSNLFWPLRFSSFAGLALLSSTLAFVTFKRNKHGFRIGLLILGLFMVILLDGYFSLNLVFTRTQPYNLLLATGDLKKTTGWRVATLDLSQFGSAPSFYFSRDAGREQVFGWAWQGANTGQNIMLVNTAMEKGLYPYLFRSLTFLGATDLMIKKDIVPDTSLLMKVSSHTPYREVAEKGGIWYWHSLNGPYMVEASDKCLAIGRFSSIMTILFPSAEMGRSSYLDEYSLSELERYPMVILTGVNWHSRDKAEKLILEYARRGHKVFVDITGLPLKVLAKQPYLHGVYGESIDIVKPPSITWKDVKYDLQPLSDELDYWKCYVPQGLDKTIVSFEHLGKTVAVLGYKEIEGNRIYFTGANIIYHTFLTGDPAGLNLLQEIFGLPYGYVPQKTIAFTEYTVTRNGYSLRYGTDKDIEAIIPISALEGFEIRIDGEFTVHTTFENLIRLNLPAGEHIIEIKITEPPIYRWGKVVTAISTALFILYVVKINLWRVKQ